MEKGGAVYIMTNKVKTVFYVGVTSDLQRRIRQHKTHYYESNFTARYNIEYCVYYEEFTRIEAAIAREKEIKKWRREKKISLINSINPEWRDLWEDVKSW